MVATEKEGWNARCNSGTRLRNAAFVARFFPPSPHFPQWLAITLFLLLLSCRADELTRLPA